MVKIKTLINKLNNISEISLIIIKINGTVYYLFAHSPITKLI